MSENDIDSIKNNIEKDFNCVKSKEDLDAIYEKYLGKNGEVVNILKNLRNLPDNEKKIIGPKANELNKLVRENIFKFQNKFKNESENFFDITRPGKKIKKGHIHPVSLVSSKAIEIFSGMGFSVIPGYELETEWYNFDALNIPADHPARDMWDTFWIKDDFTNKKDKIVLRTHTSPGQVHFMQKNNPPLRVIIPGRTFRHEATDASHEYDFSQLEGLMVDENISVANFKKIITDFLQRFSGNKNLKIRLRPSFFPFTEPSFEVDASCIRCQGKGCSLCKNTGWMEIMGAGMVHPNVFKAAGLNPNNYQGFAFGVGLDRLALLKYNIGDIRLLKSGDMRFLEQF
ncbi:MAG TPA: phenylalanine--tRNA ligase subunit alpha [Candidatus Pacearchaeota archaeon]|nr:phenylalanine--tRNA ligase subunit alpha [Candidatus Pacearchaeota archaeon]HOU45871.1 phenylalanine--tRNA ligase subunit alpha [Candidatus Pacearchaeota archaeon]HPM08340.1 phenylalanine--tRNA ligase subunit alpha [Candidatus Pacearchaeota archaeon]HQI74338.1 phenylalanine--tRNA ligase subunit alpha [Candidatus Pacearchaeota archaeon]